MENRVNVFSQLKDMTRFLELAATFPSRDIYGSVTAIHLELSGSDC
jgi:hypothetical protein